MIGPKVQVAPPTENVYWKVLYSIIAMNRIYLLTGITSSYRGTKTFEYPWEQGTSI